MEEEDIYPGYYDPMAIGRIIPNADGSPKPDWEDVACYLPNTAIKATGQLPWRKTSGPGSERARSSTRAPLQTEYPDFALQRHGQIPGKWVRTSHWRRG